MPLCRRYLPLLLLPVLLFFVPTESGGTSRAFVVRIAILSECSIGPALVAKEVAVTCRPGSIPYQTEIYRVDEEGERPMDSSTAEPVAVVEELPRVPFSFDAIQPAAMAPHGTNVGTSRFTGRIVHVTF